MEKSDLEVELIMSLYFFMLIAYLKDWIQKNGRTGLVSSAKKQSYVNRLSSLLQDPNLINKQLEDLPGQYYLLKEYFRVIYMQKGGWDPIVLSKNQITTTQRYF
jgi:hypothetical protein